MILLLYNLKTPEAISKKSVLNVTKNLIELQDKKVPPQSVENNKGSTLKILDKLLGIFKKAILCLALKMCKE